MADRAVTSILYLNAAPWDPKADGGCLRLHHHHDDDGFGGPSGVSSVGSSAASIVVGSFTDVSPLSGRLVVFDSRRVLHEVLPAFRERWALSAWIPSAEAYER